MTEVERLALRCVFPGFEGTRAPEWVLRRAARGLGGALVFARNVATRDQLASLTAELHGARPELLVAVDEEGGDVTRLEARTGSSYPGNLALGYAGDLSLTRDVGAAVGAELAAVGVDLNLAPVADVNTRAENPIIGVRSFGSDAADVARYTAAWIEGLQSAGVAACAKHFPGHGDTAVDSHLDLPVVHEDPHHGALEPFVAAFAAGARAVMSAHILVPSVDDAPGTLSHKVMTGLLRDELGFEGMAISDGLEMHGVSHGLGVAEGAVRALVAGCDALCIGGGLADEGVVEDIVAALSAAVSQGRLSEQRLREAAGRIDALAAWRQAHERIREPNRGVGLVAARRGLCASGDVAVGDEAAVVRFPAPASIAAGEVPWGVAAPLAARGVEVNEIDADAAAHHLPMSRLVIVVRDLHRRPEQQQLVEQLLERRPDSILVEMGVPICRPQGARAYIATHGSARVCGEAAAEVLHP
jgi:beta-N-acetylhexosaminidase